MLFARKTAQESGDVPGSPGRQCAASTGMRGRAAARMLQSVGALLLVAWLCRADIAASFPKNAQDPAPCSGPRDATIDGARPGRTLFPQRPAHHDSLPRQLPRLRAASGPGARQKWPGRRWWLIAPDPTYTGRA